MPLISRVVEKLTETRSVCEGVVIRRCFSLFNAFVPIRVGLDRRRCLAGEFLARVIEIYDRYLVFLSFIDENGRS